MEMVSDGSVDEFLSQRYKACFIRFRRAGFKARLSAEAAEMAAQDMPFEVVYYPKAGWADFVVKAEVVEKALKVFWTAGMRVKMVMEADDSSRMTWFQGTLSSVFVPESGPWKGSP